MVGWYIIYIYARVGNKKNGLESVSASNDATGYLDSSAWLIMLTLVSCELKILVWQHENNYAGNCNCYVAYLRVGFLYRISMRVNNER